MRLTIIPNDGVIGVDRLFRKIDMSGIDANLHAVQFDDATGEGELEFKDRRPNQKITDRAQFQAFIDRWTAAAPPPPPPPPTPAELEVQARNRIQNDKLLRAIVTWLAGRFGIPLAQARDEIAAIYRNL